MSSQVTGDRKGSGAFPFLKGYGTSVILSKKDDGGVELSRVLFTPAPPAEDGVPHGPPGKRPSGGRPAPVQVC